MDAVEMSPPMLGRSASESAQACAMVIGVFGPLFFAPVTVLALIDISSTGDRGGHLPWPVLQWAFASPMGVLAVLAVGALIAGLPPMLLLPHMWQGHCLAWATDVTGMPLADWRALSRAEAMRTRAERWLGRGARERRLSVALLVLGALLAVGLLAAFLASAIFTLTAGEGRCGPSGCAPGYPTTFSIGIVSEFAALGLYFLAHYRWLRRVEMSSGISLRYRTSFWAAPYYYIRAPGVTPEAATDAVARSVPGGRAPLTRAILVSVLALTPLVLLVSGSMFLGAWLRLQWIPG
jgi:hypothetical protein